MGGFHTTKIVLCIPGEFPSWQQNAMYASKFCKRVLGKKIGNKGREGKTVVGWPHTQSSP